jgi:hypothetical protein
LKSPCRAHGCGFLEPLARHRLSRATRARGGLFADVSYGMIPAVDGPVMPAPESAPIVFVVDDDESVREALASLVRSAGLRVEVFASAQAFLTRPPVDAPSCLVLEVRLQGASGLDLQRLAELNTQGAV